MFSLLRSPASRFESMVFVFGNVPRGTFARFSPPPQSTSSGPSSLASRAQRYNVRSRLITLLSHLITDPHPKERSQMARPFSLSAQACLLSCALSAGLAAAQTLPAEKASPASTPPSPTLVQFNDALQQLAAKVSAGVVQVLVNGYGAVEGSSGKG